MDGGKVLDELIYMVLTLDGDMSQSKAIVSDEAQPILRRLRLAVMKFAAACSGSQQPNDNSKGFLGLHSTLKAKSYRYKNLSVATRPSYMGTPMYARGINGTACMYSRFGSSTRRKLVVPIFALAILN